MNLDNNVDTQALVRLNREQLTAMGDIIINAKEKIDLQKHFINLIPNTKEATEKDIATCYHAMYNFLDDVYTINSKLTKELDLIAAILLNATDQKELNDFLKELQLPIDESEDY